MSQQSLRCFFGGLILEKGMKKPEFPRFLVFKHHGKAWKWRVFLVLCFNLLRPLEDFSCLRKSLNFFRNIFWVNFYKNSIFSLVFFWKFYGTSKVFGRLDCATILLLQKLCPENVVELGLMFGGCYRNFADVSEKVSETSFPLSKCSSSRSVLLFPSVNQGGSLTPFRGAIIVRQFVFFWENVFLLLAGDCNKCQVYLFFRKIFIWFCYDGFYVRSKAFHTGSVNLQRIFCFPSSGKSTLRLSVGEWRFSEAKLLGTIHD